MANITEFIDIYQNKQYEAYEWIENNSIDALSWENIITLVTLQAQKLAALDDVDEAKYIIGSTTILFEKHADLLKSTAPTYDQFLILVKEQSLLAVQFSKRALDAIMPKTWFQFIAIATANNEAARFLIKKEPQIISALFDSKEKLKDLKKKNEPLAQEIKAIQNKISTSKSNPPKPPMYIPFYLKFLFGLALIAGSALLIAGIVLLNPIMISLAASSILLTTGGAGLYRLFSAKKTTSANIPFNLESPPVLL